MPGRAAEVRSLMAIKLAATMVLRMPIRDGSWTAKARSGLPGSDPDDDPSVWTGVLPLRTGFDAPTATRAAGIPLPASIRRRLDGQA